MRSITRPFAIAGLLAIAACAAPQKMPAPPPLTEAPRGPVAANPLDSDQPNYLRLPGLPDGTPVRVGIILPFGSSSAPTRALAQSMMKAAQLAMFDAGNRSVLLMTADEGNGGAGAAAGLGANLPRLSSRKARSASAGMTTLEAVLRSTIGRAA